MAGKKIIAALDGHKATIGLAGLLVFSYVYFSQGNLFIEKNTLVSMAFSIWQPSNIIFYMLMHMSI